MASENREARSRATVLLEEVLEGDEIRTGGRQAGLDAGDLRASAMARMEEICGSAATEYLRLVDARSALMELERRASSQRWYPPLYIRSWRYLFFGSLTILVVLYGGAGIGYAFGWESGIERLWASLGLIGLVLIVAFVVLLGVLSLALNSWNRWRVKRMESGTEYLLLKGAVDTAEAGWLDALREKGIKGVLRDEINSARPSYALAFNIRRVAGLAELHDPAYLVGTPAEKQMQELLNSMPGGSVGIAGPRGAGKTTLLRRFCARDGQQNEDSRDNEPLRVLVSAPVRYDAREFVIHLFAIVCQALVPPERQRRPRFAPPERLSWVARYFIALIPTVTVLIGIWGMVLILSVIFNWSLNPNLQVGLLCLLVGAGGLYSLFDMYRVRAMDSYLYRHPTPDQDSLQATAQALLDGLAFQQTVSQGWTGGIKLPIGIEGSATSTTTMTERPMGFPELVDRFAAFLRQIVQQRPVYIGIDELDKIDSDEDAYRFINDIKGVFGLEKCFYFISVSQNALSAFERRGLPVRDAFDSAFDAVVEVKYMSIEGARRVVRRRVIGMPEAFLWLCQTLSGGLPRDIIRVARDMVLVSENDDGDRAIEDIVGSMVALDIQRKLAATMFCVQKIHLEPEVGSLIKLLPDSSSVECLQSSTVFQWIQRLCLPLAVGEGDYEAERRSRSTLAELRREFAAYLYFCATVVEFFAASLDRERLELAEAKNSPGNLDRLALARQGFSISPIVSWDAISTFRVAWGMPTLPDLGEVGLGPLAEKAASEGAQLPEPVQSGSQ